MLSVVKTSVVNGQDVVDDITTLHPPIYTLHCEDQAGNEFEIETDKETFVQVTDFLDKLKGV